MPEQRKQYKVSSITSTTGITLVPVVGELGANAEVLPTEIELTYAASPVQLRPIDTVVDIVIRKK